MNEKTLKTTALMTVVLGLCILAGVIHFQEPKNIEGQKEMPSDTTVEFKGVISKVRTTDEGSMITVKRNIEQKGYIDAKASQNMTEATATVTASKSDGFLQIKRIET